MLRDRVERRGRFEPHGQAAPVDIDVSAGSRPARQRLANCRPGRLAGRKCHRTRLGRAVGERERITRRQELKCHQPGEHESRNPGQELEGRLAPLVSDALRANHHRPRFQGPPAQ